MPENKPPQMGIKRIESATGEHALVAAIDDTSVPNTPPIVRQNKELEEYKMKITELKMQL